MKQEKDPFRFYIYAYIRSVDSYSGSKGSVYYIGKGQGNRAYVNHRYGNTGIHTPKDSQYIKVLESNLSECGALALERRYINWYGRLDLGTGILRNLTDGGEGAINTSKITKDKQRKAKLGTQQSDDTKRKRGIFRRGLDSPHTGMKRSEITKEKQRNLKLGIKQSQEHIDKRAKSNLGKPRPQATVFCPHCPKSGGNSLMKRYHFDNCKIFTDQSSSVDSGTAFHS